MTPTSQQSSGFTRALLRWIGACLVFLAWTLSAPAAAQTTSKMNLSGTTLCADVSGASLDDGAPVIVWTCSGDPNQQWTFSPDGTRYKITVGHSGDCMDIAYADPGEGAPAIQWPCQVPAADNERFTVKQQNNGFAVVAVHSGKCLGATGGAKPQEGQAVAQYTCDGSVGQTWVISGLNVATLPSKWTAPKALSLVPVAAAALPSGKVLVWSAYDRFTFGGDNGQTYTALFDPVAMTSTEKLVTNTAHDMFCPGIANLPDGRIFVNGGSSSTKTSIYDPATATWSVAPEMNRGRGYQGSVTLNNGGVFTVGGSWSGAIGDKDGETWMPNNPWRLNSAIWDDYILTGDSAGLYRSDNHAWLFASANGRVFHAGPSKQMNWIDTTGDGSVTPAGTRAADGDAMNGNAVMYDIGRILTVGGAPDYENQTSTANAHIIDIRSGTPVVRKLTSMAYARAFNNSVVLPNGQVVVIGGQTVPVPFSDDGAVLTPELWDPATEKFQKLAAMATPRTYHSVALLLRDGRVLSGGGGLCGGCTTNHPNVEILTPPYLLNADGSAATRPTISSAPADALLGTTISVSTNTPVSKFALVRMSSVTHSVNNEQRRVPVTFTVGTAGENLVKIPSDPGVAVPGYYYLFAMNAAGVPSVAKVIRVH
ncbi:RICIN domain-containing protein [Cupriavidus sp. SK-3]|uniref:RICIN domain-containing protein n=1 Tax=Cupriavidus sp. SK-3 TaxID=1470558 RepID=UPI00044797B5|nr:RICIN domain-containing protein [Cupriavidus sp. SK-3]